VRLRFNTAPPAPAGPGPTRREGKACAPEGPRGARYRAHEIHLPPPDGRQWPLEALPLRALLTYGPFAKELYADLQKLQEEGLGHVDDDSEEDKIRITIADLGKVEQTLTELPDELKENAATIIDTYGDLDHNTPISTGRNSATFGDRVSPFLLGESRNLPIRC